MRLLLISADRTLTSGRPLNFGDAFLTDALADGLTRMGHSVAVGDMGPGAMRRAEKKRVAITGVLGLYTAIRRADAVILGGGTLIQDNTKNALRGSLMRLCLSVSVVSFLARRPMYVFGVGCSAITRRSVLAGYRIAMRRRTIWVRDKDSLGRCREYFSKASVRLGGDAALLYNDDLDFGDARSGAIVLAAEREDAGALSAAFVADVCSLGHPVFVSMFNGGPSDDDLMVDNVRQRLAFSELTSWQDAAREVAAAYLVVASRMHVLYMALILRRPMIAVGQSDKIRSFAEEFDVPLTTQSVNAVLSSGAPGDPMKVSAAVSRTRAALADLNSTLRTAAR